MKLIYLKSALKCDAFDVTIDIKIPFFRVLVTIEPGRSLLQFVTTNCLTIRKVTLLELSDIFFSLVFCSFVTHVSYFQTQRPLSVNLPKWIQRSLLKIEFPDFSNLLNREKTYQFPPNKFKKSSFLFRVLGTLDTFCFQ